MRGKAQPQARHRDLQPQSPDMPHSCGAVLRSGHAVTASPGEPRLAQARWQRQRESLRQSARCDEHGGPFAAMVNEECHEALAQTSLAWEGRHADRRKVHNWREIASLSSCSGRRLRTSARGNPPTPATQGSLCVTSCLPPRTAALMNSAATAGHTGSIAIRRSPRKTCWSFSCRAPGPILKIPNGVLACDRCRHNATSGQNRTMPSTQSRRRRGVRATSTRCDKLEASRSHF